ncbi:hypothetical protein EDM56_02135 [Brevibacillus fluminis]|uniref:Uncharacterized protein n=1 Tax=Brevibacillus fluminis TaxID=511487 RepID=A0A3M8DWL8_9BACL|nr:hypothetical protein [Brevibacillus fluminis]RNB92516.1 hypothetical protein EDM56_02135 [Brevibacillus fluminis]
MLAVKASRLVELVEQKEKLEREKDLLLQFTTRKQQLKEALEGLAEVTLSMNTMRNIDIACPDFTNVINNVSNMAEVYRKNIEQQPEWILESSDIPSFVRSLKSASTTVKKALLDAWKTYVNSLLPQINQETLLIFRKISSFRADIEKMEHHLQAIHTIASCLPLNDSDIKKLQDRSADIHQIWMKFGQGNVPKEVLDFLKLAGSSVGAPIHLLTPEVITWLEDHGITNHCTIRI